MDCHQFQRLDSSGLRSRGGEHKAHLNDNTQVGINIARGNYIDISVIYIYIHIYICMYILQAHMMKHVLDALPFRK